MRGAWSRIMMNIEFRGANSSPEALLHADAVAREWQSGETLSERVKINPEIKQGAYQHVAADPREWFNVYNAPGYHWVALN